MTNAAGVVSGVTEKWNERQARVAELAAEIERLRSIHQDIGGIGGCADWSGMRAVAAVADANKRADKARARAAELEGLVRKHALRECAECMGTGSYLGDEDRNGPCDACGGTGRVLPGEVSEVLAEREGGR